MAEGGYDVELLETIAAAEPCSFWFRARNRLIVSTLRRCFPRAERLLEVGCGTGFVLASVHQAFPELRLVGSDLHREALAIARRRLPAEIELVEHDARRLPYENEFDVVGAFDVLEHLDRDDQALAGMSRALRREGGVILLVPQHPRLWSDMDLVARHVRRYSRRELVRKVEGAGLDVIETSSFVASLLPALVASRAARRFSRRPYDPVAELLPGPLNRFFERVLDAERRLIERGVSLPVGASLLVVARRR